MEGDNFMIFVVGCFGFGWLYWFRIIIFKFEEKYVDEVN